MSDDNKWISVEDELPEVDQWVIVLEDYNDNPSDAFYREMWKRPLQQVKPARIAWIDSDGSPRWYLCYIGGGPAGEYRNVTHWQPMPGIPSFCSEERIPHWHS